MGDSSFRPETRVTLSGRRDSRSAPSGTSRHRSSQVILHERDEPELLAVTAELATDLKGDRFQESLLEEPFKGLVAGASTRMKVMLHRNTLAGAA
jgi:hypothetical protein